MNIEVKETTDDLSEFQKEIANLNAEVIDSLKDIVKKYSEKNISVNGNLIDFADIKKKYTLEQDKTNPNLFTLGFVNTFDGLTLQKNEDITTKIQFTVVKEKNNYYVQFDGKKSTFDKPVEILPTTTGTQLLYGDVIYDLSVPNEKTKTTDIRIEANKEKTTERILKKISDQKFESFVKITEKPEFENTQVSGLTKINLWKEIEKEENGYSRSIYLYDEKRGLYRPVAKVYFDNLGKIDQTKTANTIKEKNQSTPFKILGEILWLKIGIAKDETLQFKFDDADIKKLETRIDAHRKKLISYIDKAKIAPGSQFNEFDKIDKERPRHTGEKKFLFETTGLELDIINDTYVLKSKRTEDKTIKFGFDINENPDNDKIYLKDAKGDKIEKYFEIKIDSDNIYRISDTNGTLTISKYKEAQEDKITQYPEYEGKWANFVKNTNRYYEKEKKIMKYYDKKDGKETMEIPVERNNKNERKLGDINENIVTDYLIDMNNFDAKIYQKLNITENDIKKAFFTLMFKENITLTGRWSVKILINPNTGKYEYYIADQKKAGESILLEKDTKLYEAADRAMELIKKRMEVLSKIENIGLYRKNKGKIERFEPGIGGGRGLENSSLTTTNKLAFINGETNVLSQSILWAEGEKSIINYKIKWDDMDFDIKDSRSIKLENTWLLKRKIKSAIDSDEYKVNLETGKEFKLIFDPIEKKQ